MVSYTRVATRVLPYSEMISSCEPYQHNRISEKRYKTCSHLRGVACDRRREFSIAIFGNRRIMVDGHSRVAAEKAGVLTGLIGYDVSVTYYTVANEESLLALYKTFDSKFAVEKPKDEVVTAMSYAGLSDLSDFTKSIAAKSAMELASGTKNLEDANLRFAPVMRMLDDANICERKAPACKKWGTGIKAAMLLTIELYEQEALLCWMDYFNDRGRTSDLLYSVWSDSDLGATGNKRTRDNVLNIFAERLMNRG